MAKRIERYSVVRAVFNPKRLDTLRPECLPFIGKTGLFQAMWKIDEEDGGPYVGQWAMGIIKSGCQSWRAEGLERTDELDDLFVGWIPEEDLEIIKQ